MYQFSRAIYRELHPRVREAPYDPQACAARQRLLDACDAAMRRLETDHRYFARPTRWLFSEVRGSFSLQDQLYAYRVIERNVNRALEYLERAADDPWLAARVRPCLAHTRRGTPCERQPLPGGDYCPSHKHLADDLAAPVGPRPAGRTNDDERLSAAA